MLGDRMCNRLRPDRLKMAQSFMLRHRFGVYGLLLLLVFFSVRAHAQIVIRTTAQTDTAPKFILRSNQPNAPVEGLCIDIDRAIERLDSGLRITGDQSWMPPNQVIRELGQDHLDMGCGFMKTDERKNYHFIEPPLFTTDLVLVARANDPVVIHNWDDLRALGDKAVILVDHDYALVNMVAEHGGLHYDDSTWGLKDNLQKLRAGKGRFYLHRLLGLVDGIKRAGMNDDVRIMPVSLYRQSYYMVFAPKASAEMVQRTQKTIATLVKSGELLKMLQKWSNTFAESQGPDTRPH